MTTHIKTLRDALADIARGPLQGPSDFEQYAKRVARAALAATEQSEPLAKQQPCGCVLCTCENSDRCQGCGAKACPDFRKPGHRDAYITATEHVEDGAVAHVHISTPPTRGKQWSSFRPYPALYKMPPGNYELYTRPAKPLTDGWLPIESAPKDGTWILGINNRGNQAVIIWNDSAFDRGRIIPGWIHPFSDGSLSQFWNSACGSVATHWQPLPPAPKEPGCSGSGG